MTNTNLLYNYFVCYRLQKQENRGGTRQSSGYIACLGHLISETNLSTKLECVRYSSNVLLNHLKLSEHSIESCCKTLQLILIKQPACGEIIQSKLMNQIIEPTLRQRSLVQLHNLVSIAQLLYDLINNYGPDVGSNAVLFENVTQCLRTLDSYTEEEQLQEISIKCKQAMHLFIHKNLKFLKELIQQCLNGLLSKDMKSPSFIKTIISCLRQIAQRDAEFLSEFGGRYLKKVFDRSHEDETVKTGSLQDQFGLEGYLLHIADTTGHIEIIDVQEIIMLILAKTSDDRLSFWVKLSLFILSGNKREEQKNTYEAEETKTEDNDDETFTGIKESKKKSEKKCRWPIRVLVVRAMLKLVESCQTSISLKQHFSLKEAIHKQKLSGCKNFLSLHLSDLIKMTFMASTDENHDVRLLGLEALEELVEMFKFAKEPEFEHIYLLEQYQAQVAAALSPAFGKLIDVEKISMHDNSPPPHVVAKACTVACKWLSSGVCSSLNDTQRVYRLLVGGLDRIRYEKQFVSYGFSEIARLKQVLAVLKAWSVIYVVTLGNSHVAKSLEELVAPEIPSLLPLWTDIQGDFYGRSVISGRVQFLFFILS